MSTKRKRHENRQYIIKTYFLSFQVLQDAIDGVKLSRNIPMQRQKTAEISFVLKAIATVISSMKKASATSPGVSKKTWNQVINSQNLKGAFINAHTCKIRISPVSNRTNLNILQ